MFYFQSESDAVRSLVSDQDQLFTAICEILNQHSNIQSQSVKHFFSVHKNCQFVFCCTAEFYFTQKIKCQSLPNSGRHQIHGCKSRTFLLSTLFSLTLDVFGTGTVVGASGKKCSKFSKHKMSTFLLHFKQTNNLPQCTLLRSKHLYWMKELVCLPAHCVYSLPRQGSELRLVPCFLHTLGPLHWWGG